MTKHFCPSCLLTFLALAVPLRPAEITAERSPHGVVVKIDGQPFTEYLTQSGTKPVLWPIIGPTGKPMTRSWPIEGKPQLHPRPSAPSLALVLAWQRQWHRLLDRAAGQQEQNGKGQDRQHRPPRLHEDQERPRGRDRRLRRLAQSQRQRKSARTSGGLPSAPTATRVGSTSPSRFGPAKAR